MLYVPVVMVLFVRHLPCAKFHKREILKLLATMTHPSLITICGPAKRAGGFNIPPNILGSCVGYVPLIFYPLALFFSTFLPLKK